MADVDPFNPGANFTAERWWFGLTHFEREQHKLQLDDLGIGIFDYFWHYIADTELEDDPMATQVTSDPTPTFDPPDVPADSPPELEVILQPPQHSSLIPGGIPMALPMLAAAVIPPLARAIALIPGASGAARFIPGFGRIATGAGLLSLADDLLEKVGIDLWPDDPDAEWVFKDVANQIDGMIASGLIDVPRQRRDGTDSPWNYLTFNLHKNPGDPGWGFVHPDYFSRKSIRAARENALRTGKRVVPVPRKAK